jgi:hypothetical protein
MAIRFSFKLNFILKFKFLFTSIYLFSAPFVPPKYFYAAFVPAKAAQNLPAIPKCNYLSLLFDRKKKQKQRPVLASCHSSTHSTKASKLDPHSSGLKHGYFLTFYLCRMNTDAAKARVPAGN